MDKKKKIMIGCGALAAVLVVAGVCWYFFGKGEKDDDNVVYVSSVERLIDLGSGNGLISRFAGVVEAQDTWEVPLEFRKKLWQSFCGRRSDCGSGNSASAL